MKKAVIFGCGEMGKKGYELLRERYNIVAFSDNNPKLWHKCFERSGIPIIPPNEIKSFLADGEVIICNYWYFYDISQQLESMGITDYSINGVKYKTKSEEFICKRCVLDNLTETNLLFNSDGYCIYCTEALEQKDYVYFPNETGKQKLEELIKTIKSENKDAEYDCLMGLSGGLDSSYLAYLASSWGLRIACIHIDDGFDTEVSKSNIKKLEQATGFKVVNIFPNKTQYNALVKAYLKSGVPNLYVPQDSVLFAALYQFIKEHDIKYFLSGGNFSLESIQQREQLHNAADIENLKDIHAKFGTEPLDKLPLVSKSELKRFQEELGIKTVMPLNFIKYNREHALKELHDFCGFEYYGEKHLENMLTAFSQLYWMPKKHGIDIRKSHLSSMIISNQLTRDEALNLLKQPIYDNKMASECIAIIKSELKISADEFDEIMSSIPKLHTDYRISV